MADFARSTHPGVQAQLDRLSRLSPAGDRLGLERIAAVLERLARPQDRLPPIFHVAGTNGKGSTVAFLRAALEASGYKVHAFTSPHLVRFNERIRVSGRLIDDDELAALLTEVLTAGEGIEPSFFEVAAAVAILAFARTPADACILEVGLGGRLDATNVIERPLVTGITSLALDHQQFLGTGLAGIAGEKAAIAKPGVPLITQLYPPEIAARVAEVAGGLAGCGYRQRVSGDVIFLGAHDAAHQDKSLVVRVMIPFKSGSGYRQRKRRDLLRQRPRSRGRSVPLLSRYEATVLLSWAVIIQASTKKKRQGPETRDTRRQAAMAPC